MTSAPCGDSGIPNAPTPGPFGKAAALSIRGLIRPESPGHLLAIASRLDAPIPYAARLDDPPESPPLA